MRLGTVGQNSDTSSADLFERLAACFGCKSEERVD